MPIHNQKKKRPSTALQRRIIDLGRWGDFDSDIDVPVGKHGDKVHVVWKSSGKVKIAFHIYDQGDISHAVLCLKQAQKQWGCRVCLVVRSIVVATDAAWNADFYVLRDFRAVARSEFGKPLAKNKLLRKWLEV